MFFFLSLSSLHPLACSLALVPCVADEPAGDMGDDDGASLATYSTVGSTSAMDLYFCHCVYSFPLSRRWSLLHLLSSHVLPPDSLRLRYRFAGKLKTLSGYECSACETRVYNTYFSFCYAAAVAVRNFLFFFHIFYRMFLAPPTFRYSMSWAVATAAEKK